MPKTKPRIDKKNAIKFRLVHRSQHDPLIADETAPQHVLQEVGEKVDDRKEQQIKYGIYFDDDYDYLKHLKTREDFDKGWEMMEETQKTTKSKIKLPSSVFPSIIEEDEGLLNKAAPITGPQLDVDPDIFEAMEDDFDLENPANQMTDDYLAEILEGGVAEDDGEDADDEYYDDDENEEKPCKSGYSMARFEKERFIYDEGESLGENDENGETQGDESDSWEDEDDNKPIRLEEKKISREETKSCFTEYSMTSSVLPRNEGLSLIDEKFETMFEKEYADDMEMGALDLDDIEGPLNPNNCSALRALIEEEKASKIAGSISCEDKLKTLRLDDNESDSDDEDKLVQLEIDLDAGKHRERLYDCESILSTYSTLYNHPKLIHTSKRSQSNKLSIDPATGMVVPQNTGLTRKNLRQLDSGGDSERCPDTRSTFSRASRISELSERDPNETPEERKARKAAFKQLKRERRIEKKANKTAFKMESDHQKRDMVRLKNDVNTMKLV